MSKPTSAVKNRWNAQNYDHIHLTVPKGERDKIREHAEQNGESLNGFIQRAIYTTITTDNEKTSSDSKK